MAIFAWLGVHAGVAKVICVKGGQEPVGGKRAVAVTSGTKGKGSKRTGQGTLAGWVAKTPIATVVGRKKRVEGDQWCGVPNSGIPGDEVRETGQATLVEQVTLAS